MAKASTGTVFRLCRERAEMSQDEVAERIMKDRSIVSRIDTGDIIPDIETAAAYASVTGGEDVIQAYYFNNPGRRGARTMQLTPNAGGGAAWTVKS